VDYGQGFAIAKPVPFTEALRDLPAYVLLARAGSEGSEDVVIGTDEETIAADLPAELQEALQAMPGGEAPDLARHMERILAGYDHTEAVLYQHKAAS
jgi:hypothetical protein